MTTIPREIREALGRLPLGPGVYIMRDESGIVLYVGKAKSLRRRVRSYFGAGGNLSAKIAALVARAAALETIVTGSEVEALLLEMNLIKEHRPRYNVSLRDDKKFPFLKITTNELYPRILHTRTVREDGARYFGPYTDAKAMRRAESTIRSIFPIRSCRYTFPTKTPVKVCLDYHLHKCPGPCEELIDPAAYRAIIDRAIAFLQGRSGEVLEDLRTRMRAASDAQRFEEAALYRNQLQAMEKVSERQRVSREDGEDRDLLALARRGEDAVVVLLRVRGGRLIGRDHFELRVALVDEDFEILESVILRAYANAPLVPPEILTSAEADDEGTVEAWLSERRGARVRLRRPQRGEDRSQLDLAIKNAEAMLTDRVLRATGKGAELKASLLGLQEALGLPRYPMRIDCLDISHAQGQDTVGASTSFVGGKPAKVNYRRYRIRGPAGNDDFASIREVVARKARRALTGGEALPDLLVIDGGRGQLSSALQALEDEGAPGIAVIALAKEEEEIYMPGRRSPLRLPSAPPLKLLQRLRDETHRFAVTYHRTRRSARTIATELTGIPGVGPATASRLLRKFGSVAGVRGASEEEIVSLAGIRPALAAKIRAALVPPGPAVEPGGGGEAQAE